MATPVQYNHVTGGSRVTFATGMAVVQGCEKIIDELRKRAAMIWDVDVEGVIWEDGCAKPAGSNVGDFEPLPLKAIAGQSTATGGLSVFQRGECRRSGARLYDTIL